MSNKPTYEELEQRVKELEQGNVMHKQAEESAKENEERFRVLSEASFEAIFLSEKGICLEQNQAAERMFDYTHSEAIGKPGTNWIIPEHREMVKNNMLSGYEEPYEAIALRKNGSSFPAEIQGKMMYFQGRDVRVTVLRDITERKLVEEDLTNSEEKYRELVESSNSIILKVDQNYCITFINLFAQDFFEFPEDEIIGKNLFETIVPETESTGRNLKTIIEKLIDNPGTYADYENENICKSGKRVWVAWKNKGIYDEEGELSDILCTGHDITDRKQAEIELRKSKQITQVLFEISNAVNTTLNLNDLFVSIHNSLKKVIEATNFFIGVYHEENDLLSFPYMADEFLHEYPNVPLENASKSGAFVYQVIIRNERLFVNRDEAGKLEKEIGEKIVGQHPEQWLGVPLNVRGKTIGSMVVQSYTNPNRYTQSDADLLSAVSHQVALAIDRKESEQALIESEEKHREIITNLNEGYYEVDLKGNFTYLNDAMAKMLGKRVNELIGVNNRTYMSNDTQKVVFQCFNTVYKTKKPSVSFNWELIRLDDGSPCYIEHSVLPLFDQSGNVVGFRGIAHEITERKQIEAAIKKERDFAAAILYWIDSIVVVLDLDGYIQKFNKAAEKCSGYTFEEVQKKPFWEILVPPGERNSVKKAILNVKTALLTAENENFWVTKDGQYRLIHWFNSILTGVDGKVEYLLCTGLDLTERSQAEKALKESEKKYKTAFKTNPDSVTITRLDGLYVDVNDGFTQISGYTRKEVMGKTVLEINIWAPPEDRKKFVSELTRNGYVKNMETRHRHKNGEYITALTSASLIELNNEPHILMIATDITHRKKTEEALKESQFLFSQMFEQSATSTCLYNPEGVIIRVNSEFCKMFGVEEEVITDGRYNLFQDQAAIGAGIIDLAKEIFEEKKMNTWEISYDIDVASKSTNTPSSKTGKIHIEVFGYPILDGDGNLQYAVLQHYDVTEKKKTQELLIQNEKMMSVGGLAAGMAHEINNPLGGMLQGIQNIQRRLSSNLNSNQEPAKELGINLDNLQLYMEKRGIPSYFNGIIESGRKAAEIISNMLHFSRKSESEMVFTNFAELIENVLELAGKDYDLKRKFDFRNINVIREFDSDVPPVPCMEMEIAQVILNLLRNATHAMDTRKQKNPPRIIIRLKKEGSMAKIEVEDNGPGFDEAIRKRVFEPFFTTKAVGEGTGLGLSVSYMIITNNHQGTMEVESEPGKGTKFIIRLPLDRELTRHKAQF